MRVHQLLAKAPLVPVRLREFLERLPAPVLANREINADRGLGKLPCADLVGVVCGTFFFGYLYAWLRRSDWSWTPVVMVMGATIFMIAGLLVGGSELMLVDQGRYLTPDTAKALNVVAEDLWVLVASGGIGITALATGVSMLGHRMASKWWAIGVIATGIIAIVGAITPLGLLLEVIWMLAFSIRLLLRTESVTLSRAEVRG